MRKIPVLFLLIFSLLPLCGCQKISSVDSETAQADINLKFSFWEPGMYREMENALQKIVDSYEELHPNVHIELISVPVETYIDWIKSTVISDDMPDIQSSHAINLADQYKAGLIVDINDFFNSESAYDPGKAWKDTFLQNKFEQVNRDYNDSYCNIPFFSTEIAYFYNKTEYDRLGLKVPETWSEFMHNCEVIKNNGKNPIVLPGQKTAVFSWLTWQIGEGLSIKRFLADKNININGDCEISLYEKNRAVLLGYWNMSKDKEFQDIYKNYIAHLQQYFSYCQNDLDLEESIAKTMFINAEAIHINTGAWDAKSFLQNPDVNFEVGTFRFPEFTSEDTKYPGGRVITNNAQSIAITKSVYKQEGKLEAAVDFLQYLTSKKVYQQFIDDTLEIPTVVGTKCDEALESFVNEGYSSGAWLSGDITGEDIFGRRTIELNQQYFENVYQADVETAKKNMEELNISPENGYYYAEKQRNGIYTDG